MTMFAADERPGMSLRRAGMVLFAVGLLTATVSATVLGVADGTLLSADGYRVYEMNPVVAAGAALTLLGALVGAAGVVRELAG